MASSTITATTANPSFRVSPLYRALFLYIEPFLAFQGAVFAARTPLFWLKILTPHADASHWNPVVHVVFDQLAGTYVLFAFNLAVTMRVADGNLAVWRALISGMFVCDLLHVWATKNALGWAVFLNPFAWRALDWGNNVLLLGVTIARALFLAGVGVGEGQETKGKAKAG